MNAPHYTDAQVALHLGEMLDVLPEFPDASVDAVVCDPPYGLADHHPTVIAQALAAWLDGDRAYVPAGKGFMGRDWDRFVPPPAAWDECWRVLKPGGHLVAFAAPRTADLMGMSIRLAGFEIRDSITWHYGAGFPKSLNVSKAIDKAGGAERTFGDRWAAPVTSPATADAARWEGWGTSLKPASEPIVVARKPLAGTVAANVLLHGTGALNIDGCRVPMSAADAAAINAKHAGMDVGTYERPAGASLNLSVNPMPLQGAHAHDGGRWPTNVVFTHAALLDTNGEVIGDACADGCVPGCPVAELDRQSTGTRASKPSKSGSAGRQRDGVYGGGKSLPRDYTPISRSDEGGASRFFPTFRYEAKAPASERPRLADGTTWPTVKPLPLMRWLVRLVTQPGGVVLDPFTGTGTTLEACIAEGMRGIGIERDQTAADLTVVRLSKPIPLGLFGEAS